jgi:nucleotide-binding universal stress UspA family protein
MMNSGVVVGVDGSSSSWQAMRWAVAQARRTGSRLRVVAAYQPRWPADEFTAAVEPDPITLARTEAVVAEMVTAARAAAPGTVVDGLSVYGPTVPVLMAAATDGALIVVGSRGHGGFSGLLVGATGLQLATHADGPVVVARGDVDASTGPVLVGADGSPGARAALAAAFDEADTRHCTVMAVRAYQVPTPAWSQRIEPVDFDGTRLRAAELSALRDLVEPWREKYPHVPVETVVTHGDAASVLTAMSTAAQLVIVGTRGHGGFTGLLLGSVGQKLLHHGHCPVMIAR